MIIDSHCHLDTRAWGDDAGVDAVVARAKMAGVGGMLAVGSGYGFESGHRAVAVARRHAEVSASVGLHPHDAKEFTEERLAEMLELADQAKVLALGEMGLDYHYNFSPKEEQIHAFRRQLQEARSRNLPVIIHDRESDGDTMRVLDEEKAWETGVLFHCYTGDPLLMRQIVDRGGFISIPGIVTFKNADTMRDVVRMAPIERLLIETDSPFLAPIPHRGKRMSLRMWHWSLLRLLLSGRCL